ncbi:MAG TPA: sigma-70 family RNA polymerase sigma factor [Gaiellaceae bacterium]|nr:sigma-70 family RNA polymerase sigma factor [Gaiellaceae bacterium]
MESPRPRSDGELVAACRDGSEGAWDELVSRFARYVHAICVQGFRLAPSDAEDVFQDVFGKVYEQLHKLRDDDAVRPWLAQLTRRTCIDKLRASSREVASDDFEPRGMDDLVGELDDALTIRAALELLPAECQEILDRFFAQDESYRTISDALSLPAGTIASRISRCLDKLKTVLEDSYAPARHVAG